MWPPTSFIDSKVPLQYIHPSRQSCACACVQPWHRPTALLPVRMTANGVTAVQALGARPATARRLKVLSTLSLLKRPVPLRSAHALVR